MLRRPKGVALWLAGNFGGGGRAAPPLARRSIGHMKSKKTTQENILPCREHSPLVAHSNVDVPKSY
jgi:hypothetical protein